MDDDEPHEHLSETMTLALRALDRGAYTHVSLTGVIAATPQGAELRRLVARLARWHGGAIDVVLGIGADVRWLATWNQALAAVSARHHRVHYLIDRSARRGDDDVF